jgi:AcrR family transcriptional regulator
LSSAKEEYGRERNFRELKAMTAKRAQGRPVRGTDEVGRQRILDAARAYLRSPSTRAVTRKDLASFAGVTPALVSYYFPNYSALIEEVTRAVIEEHLERLRAIIRSGDPVNEKLRQVIRLFVDCNIRDGRIVDSFLEVCSTADDNAGPNCLNLLFGETAAFLQESVDGNSLDPEFIQSALWGICKYAAQPQSSAVASAPPNGGADEMLPDPKHAEWIYMLVTDGIRPRM